MKKSTPQGVGLQVTFPPSICKTITDLIDSLTITASSFSDLLSAFEKMSTQETRPFFISADGFSEMTNGNSGSNNAHGLMCKKSATIFDFVAWYAYGSGCLAGRISNGGLMRLNKYASTAISID